MGNNTTLTLTADIADLKVKMAAAQAVMKETAKAANDAAKAVAMGDGSDAGRTKLLATTQAAVAAKGAFNGLAREYKNLDATEKQTAASGAQFLQNLKEQAATAGMSQKQMLAYRAEQLGVAEDAAPLIAALRGQTTHMVSSRAATEGLVLVHEALSGRYTRMTGSAMILGQALIGQTTISSVLTAAMSPLGIAIIGTAAAAGFATYEAIKYEEAQRELLATTVGLGAASGLSAEQIQAAANVASTASGQSASASLATRAIRAAMLGPPQDFSLTFTSSSTASGPGNGCSQSRVHSFGAAAEEAPSADTMTGALRLLGPLSVPALSAVFCPGLVSQRSWAS